jgi:RimJ/RimL family protein N-acetyltransferase
MLTLEVQEGNARSMRLYDRFGFEPCLHPMRGRALFLQKKL